MRHNKCWISISGTVAVLAMALMLPAGAGAVSTYKVLHRFRGADGANPQASLVIDGDGNLYGTTKQGGATGGGTVFRLTPNSDGTWTERVLHSFCSLANCADGKNPLVELTFDAAGNLYGATEFGGASGQGTVFKLTLNSDGSWAESVLYSFSGGADGFEPRGVIFDGAGNLYGTTFTGGIIAAPCSLGCGVVFKLTPNADGSWAESVLYRFCSLTNCNDGETPVAGLTFDGAGSLYGTTILGGTGAIGTVFKLTPNANGSWTHKVLHNFGPSTTNGSHPIARLTFDMVGNLYSTTLDGGGSGSGVVFKLTPHSDGSWTESVLHSFNNQPAARPQAGVIFDRAGNLYGTTAHGGSADGGVVFKLAPRSDGSWAHSVLHVFVGKPALYPFAGLALDSAGNLYGTTFSCASGTRCRGVVFEVTP